MRLARMLSTAIVVGVAAVASVFACGGDDGGGGGGGGGGGNPDAKVFLDAAPPDMASAMGIGQPCTPSMDGSGQGTCPNGYTCLSLTGGSGPWCSKTCTRGSGDQCNAGYTGPGLARCIWDITFGSAGGTPIQYCGVICADSSPTCGAACNGTCPGAMTCTQGLTDGSGNAIGSACK